VSAGARDKWGTVWLCRPGEAADPCVSSLTTTVIGPTGARHVERAAPAKSAPVDCFYLYPTISGQPTVNANLAIDFRLRAVATAPAAPFSQVCRVYAPVYRQITLSALEHPAHRSSGTLARIPQRPRRPRPRPTQLAPHHAQHHHRTPLSRRWRRSLRVPFAPLRLVVAGVAGDRFRLGRRYA